jgi:hypothetical protein
MSIMEPHTELTVLTGKFKEPSAVGSHTLNHSFLVVERMMHQGPVALFHISSVITVEATSHSFVTDKESCSESAAFKFSSVEYFYSYFL